MSVEWCPTADMVADFWTKPNQGQLFRRNRDLIMGVDRQAGVKVVTAKEK